MSKYEPLRRYLDTYTITLTYQEIEEILGFKLPDSAYIHSAWWDNGTGNHVQTEGWVDAGWKVVKKDLGKSITFQKYSEDI
ncbi:hypothetical protein ACFQZE_06945 [Paenibacillus sp. GCM10027627]|uniref:DUF7662 domain-containing protein n=1 Tax=unclassified Paenibacillus TaxID=185978 RepID=UPI00362BB560